ncbi:putative peptide modification system cyclase [Dokdonella fugitiva]|nr:putative peptide modification system cyclase [Dokdonella fugitiva]
MNALLHPSAPIPQATAIPLLRTLVLCDLVDSTALTQRLGDQHAAELFRKHDRLARALLPLHGGREIDKTDGFLLMFERPVQAVAFAIDYQRALRELNATEGSMLAARVGIHVGDVVAWDNSAEDIARGAKPIEVEGLVKPITSRLTQLALPNQILLSGVAHALAHRAQGELGERLETLRWRTHGRYRFKGVPDPIPVFEVGDEGFAPLKAPPWSGKAHREVPFWRRPATLGIEVAALLLMLAIPAWYLLRPAPAIAFANRDWVVVGDLKNLTGDTRFDDSIQTAFRIGLEQSRYVNVLSNLKARETIGLMRKDPEKTSIDRVVGAEIALRDGARALILPTVAEIGGRVRVTAEVVDPTTQTTVYSESADGLGVNSVLPSLDTVSQKLRVRLGEALATVAKETRPLANVATANLEALRAYSLAIDAYVGYRYKDALPLFEQAIKLDADFTLARIGMARVLFLMDRNQDASEQLKQAAAKSERLSPRDSLYLDAWSASLATPSASLQKWKVLAELYPDFFAATGSYAYFLWLSGGSYDAAIAAAKKSATEQNPHRGVSHQLLGTLYLGTERFGEAVDSFERANAAGVLTQNEYYAATYAAQRKFAKAKELLDKGSAPGQDSEKSWVRVAMAIDQGKLDDVMHVAAPAGAASAPSRVDRRSLGVDLALRTAVGSSDPLLAKALTSYRDEGAALLKASSDDVDRADTEFELLLADYLMAQRAESGQAHAPARANLAEAGKGTHAALDQMLAIAQAEELRANNRPDQAIELLRSKATGDELYLSHAALLDAYIAAKKNTEALAEARWLTAHRGRAYAEYNSQRELTALNVLRSNLALLSIAELTVATDKDAARTGLDAFRQAWPDAERVPTLAKRMQNVRSVLGGGGQAH